MHILLMGVSGSGKSTIGSALARVLRARFIESDDYHPTRNITKMRSGIHLNDKDRLPWLDALARVLNQAVINGEDIVLSCSASQSFLS